MMYVSARYFCCAADRLEISQDWLVTSRYVIARRLVCSESVFQSS